ncbi:MAG: PaaI family thioesterase [Myxococcota bacterium]
MSEEPIDLDLMNAAFRDFVPHNRALGLSLVAASWEPAQVTLKLPWNPRLIGNPATQVMHGGAITTVLDGCAGASVYMKLRSPQPIATLDLRVDFLGRAPAHRDVLARAECHRVTRSVAFVRAWAWVDDEQAPFATATATFALSARGRALTEEEVRKGLGT